MKSNLPAPTAKNINEAHRLARSTAESAVEYAIQCGRLLAAKKEDLPHGEFQGWIEKSCDFSYKTAALYMKAAKQKSNALDFSSVRHLFPSGQPGAKPKSNTQKGAVSVVNPEGGRTTGAKEGTEETGNDRPAAPFFGESPKAPSPVESDPDAPERPDIDDEEEAAALERAESRAKADRERRIDTILQAEDQLAEAVKQIAQQSALIGVLETTRDGYMRGKEAVTKMLQAEQRKVAKLEKENKSLRERLGEVERPAVNGGRHERPAVRA